jgi:hypothetical protein
VFVTIPVAIVHWPYGPIFLALARSRRSFSTSAGIPATDWWRSPWVRAAGGVVLVLSAAVVSPHIGAARPPAEAPDAAAPERGQLALADRVRPMLLFDGGELLWRAASPTAIRFGPSS